MVFFDLNSAAAPSIQDLVGTADNGLPYDRKLTECRDAVHRFLDQLFTSQGGVRAVEWKPEGLTPQIFNVVAHYARLTAALRTPFGDADAPFQPESPHRLNAILRNLARGHALVQGRFCLTLDDVPLIGHIALSSIPERARAVLLALVKNDGARLTVKQVEQAARVSRHTAEEIMAEMEVRGFAKLDKRGNGKASYLVLDAEWQWVALETSGPISPSNLAGFPGCSELVLIDLVQNHKERPRTHTRKSARLQAKRASRS